MKEQLETRKGEGDDCLDFNDQPSKPIRTETRSPHFRIDILQLQIIVLLPKRKGGGSWIPVKYPLVLFVTWKSLKERD